MGSAEIRERLVSQLRRDLNSYAQLAAIWHRHHGSCLLCRPVKAGASRGCAEGRQLLREARAAKWAANTEGEEVVNALGKKIAEAIAREELPASFEPVPG